MYKISPQVRIAFISSTLSDARQNKYIYIIRIMENNLLRIIFPEQISFSQTTVSGTFQGTDVCEVIAD